MGMPYILGYVAHDGLPLGGTRPSPPASPVDTQTPRPPPSCNNVSIAGPPPPLALQLGVGTLDSVTLGAWCPARPQGIDLHERAATRQSLPKPTNHGWSASLYLIYYLFGLIT